MKFAEDIILKPHITEKSNIELADGKYTFLVDTKATKTEIRSAVEELFKVKVIQVNTVNYGGKPKRMGAHQGTTSKWKKAVVKIDTDPQPEIYIAKDGKKVVSSKKYRTSIEEFGITQ